MRRGLRHPPHRGGRGRRRPRLRGRPRLGRRLLHRRQRRHQRGRQESRPLGHDDRQPRLVEDGRRQRPHDPRRARQPQLRPHPRGRDRRVRHPRALRRGRGRQDRAPLDSGPHLPQGGPRQGRHQQASQRPARHTEGRHGRHHRERRLRAAPDARLRPHGLPRVLRHRGRIHTRHRRGARLRARPSDGRACGSRAHRLALRARRRLPCQARGPRHAQDGASRRHRLRQRSRPRRRGRTLL